jgi:aspartyl protease family protein
VFCRHFLEKARGDDPVGGDVVAGAPRFTCIGAETFSTPIARGTVPSMSTFTVSATLRHPFHRERSIDVDMLVDTGASYILLPPEIVDHLGLETRIERRMRLANGQVVVYRLGDVHINFNGEDHTTTFLAGPSGCRALFGAYALELFGLAVDPVNRRLFEVPGLL